VFVLQPKGKMNFELANAGTNHTTAVFRSKEFFALVVHARPDSFDDFFQRKAADFDWFEALKTAFKSVRDALIVVVDYHHSAIFTLDIGHVARAHFFAGDECTKLFIEDADVRKVFCVFTHYFDFFLFSKRRGVWCASPSRNPAVQPSW